jgi:hypothetical protein
MLHKISIVSLFRLSNYCRYKYKKLHDVLFRKLLNTTKFARMFNKKRNQENNKKTNAQTKPELLLVTNCLTSSLLLTLFLQTDRICFFEWLILFASQCWHTSRLY